MSMLLHTPTLTPAHLLSFARAAYTTARWCLSLVRNGEDYDGSARLRADYELDSARHYAAMWRRVLRGEALR
jgi:hypothetical protein